MGERFVNNFSTTLSGDITNSATSIGVAAGASYAGTFRAMIVSTGEIIKVTAGGDTTTWTVVRGTEGTSGTAATSGDELRIILTEEAVETLIPTVEAPTGTKNDSNDTFTISRDARAVMIVWGGVLYPEDDGFTRSGTTITMDAGNEPGAADSFQAMLWG